MKNIINSLLAISAAAMLVACGGGGSSDGSNTTNPNPATPSSAQSHASPGVFVPTGQASSTINLVNCRERRSLALLTPSNATIRIDANGDVTFIYAGGSYTGNGGGQVPAISHVIAAASSIDSEIVVGSTQGIASNYYEFKVVDAGLNGISLGYQRNNPNPDVAYFNASNSPDVDCELDSGTVMTSALGDINARIAAITAGITSVNSVTLVEPITFATPLITWRNGLNDANIRAQLNITTGVVSVVNQAGAAFTPLNFSQLIDPANASNEPRYSERRETAASANTGVAYQVIDYSDTSSGTNSVRITVNSSTEFETNERH
jgi:hypothetical protein